MRDANHPAGPGRLVRITRHRAHDPSPARWQNGFDVGRPAQPLRSFTPETALVLEENTPLVEARLEAVALGPLAERPLKRASCGWRQGGAGRGSWAGPRSLCAQTGMRP